MPKVTIWIRNEDWDKWKELQRTNQIPRWIHYALNTSLIEMAINQDRPPKPVKQIIDETNQAVVESLGNSEVIAALNAKLDNVKEKFISEHPLTNARTDGEPEGLDAIINDPKYEPMEDA